MRLNRSPFALSLPLVALLCLPVLAGGGKQPVITIVDEPDPLGVAVQIDAGKYGSVFSELRITDGVDPIPQVTTITDGADPVLIVETIIPITDGADPVPSVVASIIDLPDPISSKLRIVYTIPKPKSGGK